MAVAQFNDPFWVAVAAAAPVIGLAAAVTAEQAGRSWERANIKAIEAGDRPVPLTGAYVVAYINILLQGTALFAALASLSTHTDELLRGVVIVLVFGGMVLAIVPSALVLDRIDKLRTTHSRQGNRSEGSQNAQLFPQRQRPSRQPHEAAGKTQLLIGLEHYQQAEDLLGRAVPRDSRDSSLKSSSESVEEERPMRGNEEREQMIARAQVHATLALAATNRAWFQGSSTYRHLYRNGRSHRTSRRKQSWTVQPARRARAVKPPNT